MISKYLNQTYDKWKVVSAVNTKGGHKSFILGKKDSGETLFMTLRDNQLSKVASAQTSMDQVVFGKLYQLSKNIRQTQNNIISL